MESGSQVESSASENAVRIEIDSLEKDALEIAIDHPTQIGENRDHGKKPEEANKTVKEDKNQMTREERINETDVDNSTTVQKDKDARKKRIFFCYFWWLGVIAALVPIVIGSIFLNDCPASSSIPLFLIVIGVIDFILYIVAVWKEYLPKDKGRFQYQRIIARWLEKTILLILIIFVIREVYETMMREEPARRPQRRIADCIVRDYPTKQIADMIDKEDIGVDDVVTKGLRLLHFAVFRHNVEVLLLLLDYGADPNLMDDVGYTPLHLCAEKGYSDFIRILLSYGARLRFTEINPGDKPFGDPPRATAADEPLRLAIRNYEHETALLLLKHGANPSATYYLGQEINMVDPTDTPSLELLLKYGADPNARDRQGMTPLMKACRNPEAIDATYLLISYGADVNAMTTEDKKTPMHYAVLSGNMTLVEILVSNGARVQFSKEYSKPPPHYFAVLRGHVEILNYLLDNGADVNFESAVVGSALHIALTERIPNKSRMVRLLLKRGANPNAITLSDKGPLLKPPIGEYFQACEQPETHLVRLLLRYGGRVILKGQRDHPLGIVKVIHRLHLGLNPDVMALVIEAAEKFNISFIEQSTQLSDEHKELLLEKALKPFSLVNIARFQIRNSIKRHGDDYVSAIKSFPIPYSLTKLLLFQEDEG